MDLSFASSPLSLAFTRRNLTQLPRICVNYRLHLPNALINPPSLGGEYLISRILSTANRTNFELSSDDEDCQIKWYANHLGDNFDVENCRAYVTAIEETASAVYQAAHANGSAYDDDDDEEEEEEMEIDWSDSVVGNETEYDDDASGKYEIDWDTGLYKQKDEIEQVDYIPGKDQLEWGDCIPEMIEELQPDEPQPEMTSDDDEIAVVRGWPTERYALLCRYLGIS